MEANEKVNVIEVLKSAQAAIDMAIKELSPREYHGEHLGIRGDVTYAKLRMLLDSGAIHLKVGDRVFIKHGNLGLIEWTVIDVGGVQEHAGVTREIVTLWMSYCTSGYKLFDEPTREFRSGRNSWADSSLRGYLNGEFLYVLEKEDRAAINITEKKTSSAYSDECDVYTTYDKFFVLSAPELGIAERGTEDEGGTYQFFKDNPTNRQRKTVNGDDVLYWTRSPVCYDNEVCAVDPLGGFCIEQPNVACGVIVACTI